MKGLININIHSSVSIRNLIKTTNLLIPYRSTFPTCQVDARLMVRYNSPAVYIQTLLVYLSLFMHQCLVYLHPVGMKTTTMLSFASNSNILVEYQVIKQDDWRVPGCIHLPFDPNMDESMSKFHQLLFKKRWTKESSIHSCNIQRLVIQIELNSLSNYIKVTDLSYWNSYFCFFLINCKIAVDITDVSVFTSSPK